MRGCCVKEKMKVERSGLLGSLSEPLSLCVHSCHPSGCESHTFKRESRDGVLQGLRAVVAL
jgi:hypothetical protein